MRTLSLLAAGAVLGVCSLGMAQATRPATPATQPAAPATQPAGAARPTTAPSTTRPTTLPSADSFLPDLKSDSWQKRLHAAESLVRLGEDARPIIKDLLHRPIVEPEVRARLETALAQIDENRIAGVSYITMHLVDASPREVFTELSRQCFANLKPVPDNLFEQPGLPRVNLDLDHEPFWAALAKIAEQTGIDLQQYNDGPRLMRGGFRVNSPYSVIHGPFLVVATSLNRNQTEMLANGGSSSDFSMQLMAYSEPKLHILNNGSSVKLREVVDDAGNSLIPTGPDNRYIYGGNGGCWNLYAQLKYPEHPGKKILRFKGSAPFTIQTSSQRIEIADLLTIKEVTRTVGDMPVIIHEIKKAGSWWELRLSVRSGPNRWAASNQLVQNQMQILDAKGQKLDHQLMRSSGNGTSMEYTIRVTSSMNAEGNNSADPAKLVWEVPTSSKEINVDFEFKNLPMPH